MYNCVKFLLVGLCLLGGFFSTGICQNAKVKDERVLKLVRDFEEKEKARGFEHEVFLAKLNSQLEAALKKEEEKAIAAGNLDAVQILRENQKLIASNQIPEKDEAGTPKIIERLRNVWRAEKAKLENAYLTSNAAHKKMFSDNLQKMEVALTKEKNIDEAIAVRELRNNLGEKTNIPSSDKGWVTIFDGTDLSGWQVKGNPKCFEVENGLLSERGAKGSNYLVYKGGGGKGDDMFADFEFRAEVRGPKDGNSGLFFHLNSSIAAGVEVNIANGQTLANSTGSIWGLQDVKKEIIGQTIWFELWVIVKGDTITVKKDGRTINEYEGKKGGFKSQGGRIAIQANSKLERGFEFRKIELRRL